MLLKTLLFLMTQSFDFNSIIKNLSYKKNLCYNVTLSSRILINSFQDEREVKVEKKNAKGEKHCEMVKKKLILLTPKSDESSSEEENENTPLQCQYKVGVSLMRQAYERILDAGLKGLTQIEIAQLIGVEFYTSRTICRIFKQKNLVREFLEDKGRQRTAR